MKKPLYVEQTREVYDAIVVGSGVTGGWAAKEFCERGYKTLMIERGRVVEHQKDYTNEGKPPWETPFRTSVEKKILDEEHPVQKKCYALNDKTRQFFGNDRDLPYQTEEGTDFAWIRGNQLGGKSLLWARQTYRLSDYDFSANSKDGIGIDWPIRSADLAPWYSYVEKHVGISGANDGLPQLPDSEVQPPFEMTSPEKAIKSSIEQEFPDRNMIIGRCAHLTQPTDLQLSQGRGLCLARNQCQNGCSWGGYFSTQSSTLPAAAATGNLHIAPNSVVQSLIYDAGSNRVRGVRVIDNENLSEREYIGKVVFLCASTLGSTQIMLMSTSQKFPNGIANSSGVLGHYLMDHNFNAGARGTVKGFEDEYYRGRRPTTVYIPNFQYEPSRYKSQYKRGYALGGNSHRGFWAGRQGTDGFGVDYKNMLNQAGDWGFNFWAQGEMLPNRDNQLSLHPTLKDKWGIPQLNIRCKWSENELLMSQDAAATAHDMLEKAGLENVTSNFSEHPPGLAIHEVGTARMGKDPSESVLNAYNQTHDIPNLFVTDGSCFPSTGTQNPSLTFMALTARAVDYAVKEMKQKRI